MTGVTLTQESVFIGTSPLFLRRLYTAIFGASGRRQEARSGPDPDFFDERLSATAVASLRNAERAFSLACAQAIDAYQQACQESKIRYTQIPRYTPPTQSTARRIHYATHTQ